MNGAESGTSNTPTASGTPSIRRLLTASIMRLEWTRFEGAAGLRCTIGIAVPLLVGMAANQPAAALFGAFGAFGVGFGSFQGAYRSQAIPMLLATLSMALSVYVGSLSGASMVMAVLLVGLWGFAGGLLVAISQAASFVGLQALLALILAHGLPPDEGGAAARALFVLGGGLTQSLLVVLIWPLRRFPAERRSLAAVYRSLAAYAVALPGHDAPPEPHTLAGTMSPLADPQPFATSGEMFGFQTLLDEAERIRASLASLAFHQRRLVEQNPFCAGAVSAMTAQVLAEIAAALAEGRKPRSAPGVSRSLAECATVLWPAIRIEPFIAQLDAAWRTAGLLASDPKGLAHVDETISRRQSGRFLRDALMTLRANLSFDSTAFRHALRLAVTVAVGEAITGALELPRGHWVPLTVAVMLKPEFHDTFASSLARVGGTALGAVGAVALALLIGPELVPTLAIILVFAWSANALRSVNPVVFAVCLTGYVVFLLSLVGEPTVGVALVRIMNTGIGGALALCAYIVWPTWTARGMREVLGTMLDKQAVYLDALLTAYTNPRAANLKALDELHRATRRARSNAEAVIEKTFAEPYGRHPIGQRTAMGTLATNRRLALAALALRAGLEAEDGNPVPTIAPFARKVKHSLHALATTVREESPPPEHLLIGETFLAVDPDLDQLVSEEIKMIVDAVETMAALLRADQAGRSSRSGAVAGDWRPQQNPS